MTASESHKVGKLSNGAEMASCINDAGNGTIKLPSCASNFAHEKECLAHPYLQVTKKIDVKHIKKYPVFVIAIMRPRLIPPARYKSLQYARTGGSAYSAVGNNRASTTSRAASCQPLCNTVAGSRTSRRCTTLRKREISQHHADGAGYRNQYRDTIAHYSK